MKTHYRQNLEKKLLYKSCYRGSKETDLIIGHFARKNLANMSDDELQDFDTLLELYDGDIYDWYTGKKPIPDEIKSDTLMQLIKFDLQSK